MRYFFAFLFITSSNSVRMEILFGILKIIALTRYHKCIILYFFREINFLHFNAFILLMFFMDLYHFFMFFNFGCLLSIPWTKNFNSSFDLTFILYYLVSVFLFHSEYSLLQFHLCIRQSFLYVSNLNVEKHFESGAQ